MNHLTGGARPLWAALRVRDAGRQARFYEQVVGLKDWGQGWLGNHRQRLLQLQEEPGLSQAPPDLPGLFHLAFLFPQRPQLASWLQRAQAQGARLEGASDHGVSEAIYLSDPEGNGLEMYWDRHRSGPMFTAPLAWKELLAEADGSDSQGLVLGHIHLQAPDLEPATAFLEGLGLQQTCTYPGARFLAWGDYHHHFAVNQWRVGRPRAGRFTGLSGYAIQTPTPPQALTDPWGHQVVFSEADSA